MKHASLTLPNLQIDVAVNAPEAGTIKEFLANEEDTVTVGQDLVKLELGGPPQSEGKETASQDTKEPASDKQPTSSDPAPSKESTKPQQDAKPSSPPPEDNKPQPSPKQASEPTKTEMEPSPKESPRSKSSEMKGSDSQGATRELPYGNRDERRVSRLQRSTLALNRAY